MLMAHAGAVIVSAVKDISVVGRNTQGVRLIRLEEGDQLSGLERIDGIAVGAVPGDDPPSPDGSSGEDDVAAGEPAADEPAAGGPAGDPQGGQPPSES